MMLSDVMEDYLKTIYELEGETGPPVSTSQVADYLDVTPPTATSMLEKLADRGFVEREKYKGVELTEEGETVALEVLRHHRLLESYLTEHLDYDWSEVHDEADVLEHHISEEFERRVAEALDDPEIDPHGDPIPGEDLAPPECEEAICLSTIDVGEMVEVVRVRDRDDEELQYLQTVGIEPGTMIGVEEIVPIGMIEVSIGEETQHLPDRIAETIRVRPVGSEAASGAPEGVSEL
ncbi:MAG: DtxR family Mn-dependent transcriptional regulator [Halobacteriales archaeon]|jgi:DtxR family Mn-dependent transcriptional regulator